MTATGHAILRAIIGGQGDHLLAAADALGRLDKLLPTASAEARLTAVLLSLTDDPMPQAETAVQSPAPTPARRKARDKASQPVKASRKSKASVPRMDASGRLLPSRKINDTDVVSQAEARKALGVSCVQMLRLENQKLLSRIQEGGMRHVYYSTSEVQRLLDLIDRTPTPPL